MDQFNVFYQSRKDLLLSHRLQYQFLSLLFKRVWLVIPWWTWSSNTLIWFRCWVFPITWLSALISLCIKGPEGRPGEYSTRRVFVEYSSVINLSWRRRGISVVLLLLNYQATPLPEIKENNARNVFIDRWLV